MGTKISWCDATWSPIVGCSKISAGCANCYAERMAARQAGIELADCQYSPMTAADRKYYPVVSNGKWNGKTNFYEPTLTKPLHWRKPRKIFVCSMSDLFHESVPFEWIDRVFAVMALCPQHQFMCLTKRAGRMREYFTAEIEGLDARTRVAKILESKAKLSMKPDIAKHYYAWFNMDLFALPNVHLGVTVENQDNAGRIEDLRATPAASKFISYEPLLEETRSPEEAVESWDRVALDGIDYAFVGCESGPSARLCRLADIGNLMDRLRRVNIKIHIKQIPLNGKCNKNIEEWPEEFRVREI